MPQLSVSMAHHKKVDQGVRLFSLNVMIKFLPQCHFLWRMLFFGEVDLDKNKKAKVNKFESLNMSVVGGRGGYVTYD